MPREIWSIQLEVTLQKALGQLSILEKRLAKIETKFRTLGAAASPAAAKNLNKLNASTKAAGNSATVAQGKFTRFFTAIRAQSDSFITVLARRLAFMAAAMIEVFAFAFAIAIPLAFAKSIKVGAEFEDAMLRTATVAAGGIENMVDHFNLLENAARQFAITVPFSATEVANAMFEMVSSGISTLETIGAMPAIMSFAGAAMTDLTTSVDIMTQVMKSFGLTAIDLDDIADILIVGLNRTTLTVERLQAALRFAAPAGGAFGQSIDDTVVVLSSFVDVTKQGGIAGRAFRFMMASLANPSAKAQAAMAKLRDTTSGLPVDMKKFALTIDGSPQSIVDVLTNLSNTTITSSQALEIFGNRSGPVVALAIRRMKDEMAEGSVQARGFENRMRELQAAMADGKAANSATVQFQTFLTSTASQFKLLKATAEEALLRIFERVQPLVNSFLKFTKAVINSNAVIDLFVGLSGELATALLFLAGAGLVRVTQALGVYIKQLVVAQAATLGVTGSVGSLRGAWIALKMATPYAIFAALILVFRDIQAETNGFGRTLEWLTGLFRNSTAAASDTADEWTFVGMVTDTLRVALAAVGIAFLNVFKAMAHVTAATLEWIPGMEEQKKSIEETIVFVDDMIQSYQDEAAEIMLNFGVREERIAQEARARAESWKRIDALEAQIEMEKISAEIRGDLTDQETEYLELILQRIKTEEDAAEGAVDFQKAQLMLMAANEDLNPFIREYAQFTLDLIKRNEEAAAAAEALATKTKLLAAAYKLLNPNQAKTIEGVASMSLVLKDLAEKGIALTETQLLRLNDQLTVYEEGIRSGAIEPTDDLILDMGILRSALDAAFASMGLIVGKTTEWKNATKGLPDVLDDLETQMREAFDTKTPLEFDESIRKMHADFRLLESSGMMSAGAMKELKVRLVETAREMFEAGASSAEVNARLFAMAQLFGVFLPVSIDHANRMLDEFEGKSTETAEVATSAYQQMFNKITQGMGNAIGEMIFSATSFADFIEDLFKGILKMLVAEVFAGILGAFTQMLFGMEKGLTEGFGKTIQDGFGSMFEGIKGLFTDFSAGTVAIIAGLAVAAFGIIKSLFGSDGAIEAVERRLAGIGGASEELTEKIRETAKEMGTVAAAAAHFGEIADEVGITVQNFGAFVEIARGALHGLNQGEITAAQATDSLNDSFARLTSEMETLGIVGNRDVIELMRQIRASGLEVASVMQFVDENMRLAASGLETVVKGSLIDTSDELNRLGRIAFAVFSEMIANGSSMVEAMEAIGPSIDMMIEKIAETGVTGGETFQTLRKWRTLIEDNKEIVSAFDGLNDIMTGLANTGLFTQEVFDDLLAQAVDLATDLTNAGVKGKDAFILMAPFLDNLIEQARIHGLAIDDATQALIDQAEEYGVLGKGAKTESDIMREGFDLIARAINELIITMGGIPLALDEIGDDFDGVRDRATEAWKNIEDQGEKSLKNLKEATEKATKEMNKSFGEVEEHTVGNTVFRNIYEKGSAFLEKLGQTADSVSGGMNFSNAENQFGTVSATPNFVVTSPTPHLSQASRGLSKFEQQNLALLGRVVDAIVGSRSSGRDDASPVPSLRQTIGEVLREASLDGDAEFHSDSVSLLS